MLFALALQIVSVQSYMTP